MHWNFYGLECLTEVYPLESKGTAEIAAQMPVLQRKAKEQGLWALGHPKGD